VYEETPYVVEIKGEIIMWYEVYVNGQSRFRAHERDFAALLSAITKECSGDDEIVIVRRLKGDHSDPKLFLEAPR
jgi:hypothetical protein